MTEQTVQLIDNLLAAWNSHDPARVASWYTEDCYGLDVAIARPQIGREGVQAMFAAYYNFCWQTRKPGKSGSKRGTACMMAGLTGHVWSFDELFEAVLA